MRGASEGQVSESSRDWAMQRSLDDDAVPPPSETPQRSKPLSSSTSSRSFSCSSSPFSLFQCASRRSWRLQVGRVLHTDFDERAAFVSRSLRGSRRRKSGLEFFLCPLSFTLCVCPIFDLKLSEKKIRETLPCFPLPFFSTNAPHRRKRKRTRRSF